MTLCRLLSEPTSEQTRARILVALGQPVTKGQPLALVQSADYATAVGAYRKAAVTAANARRLANADRDLAAHNGISAREAAQEVTGQRLPRRECQAMHQHVQAFGELAVDSLIDGLYLIGMGDVAWTENGGAYGLDGSVEKTLGSGLPSGVILPVLYLSPFKQSTVMESNTSRYRSRIPVNDKPSSHE